MSEGIYFKKVKNNINTQAKPGGDDVTDVEVTKNGCPGLDILYWLGTARKNDAEPFLYVQSDWTDETVKLRVHSTQTGKSYHATIYRHHLEQRAAVFGLEYFELRKECEVMLGKPSKLIERSESGFWFRVKLKESTDQKTQFSLYRKNPFNMLYLEASMCELGNNHDLFDSAFRYIEMHKIREVAFATDVENTLDMLKLCEVYDKTYEDKEILEKKLIDRYTSLITEKKEKLAGLQKELQKLVYRGKSDYGYRRTIQYPHYKDESNFPQDSSDDESDAENGKQQKNVKTQSDSTTEVKSVAETETGSKTEVKMVVETPTDSAAEKKGVAEKTTASKRKAVEEKPTSAKKERRTLRRLDDK